MATIPHHKSPNPLSNDRHGEDLSGLGCFPIGSTVSHSEVSDMLRILHHLREASLVHNVSFHAMQELRSRLQPLQMTQSFWAHPRNVHEAEAIHEFFNFMFPSCPSHAKGLQICIFPDSGLLGSDDQGRETPMWGLFELDLEAKTTILYISGKTEDSFGVDTAYVHVEQDV